MVSGLETLIINLRSSGFPLILLWVLTLSVVYGILSHVKIPQSMPARGVIALSSAFLVLFAAAATEATTFISNLITSGIVIAFGLLIVMIFLEIAGAKIGEKGHIFSAHPKIFGLIIIAIVILIFVGAGGLALLNLPSIRITDSIAAIMFFLAVMGVAMWALFNEGSKKGG